MGPFFRRTASCVWGSGRFSVRHGCDEEMIAASAAAATCRAVGEGDNSGQHIRRSLLRLYALQPRFPFINLRSS